jgi:hypothetical protein
MSAARRKGTTWESAIVAFLRENGVPHAERRALAGAKDRGDVAGIPGVTIEAKSAVRIDLAGWVDETEVERINDGAAVGLCWIKRRGKTSPAAGYIARPVDGKQLPDDSCTRQDTTEADPWVALDETMARILTDNDLPEADRG